MARPLAVRQPAGSDPARPRRSRQRPQRRSRGRRVPVRNAPWDVLAVISVGGAVGATARYGLGRAFPSPPGAFPATTFAINVLGCLLIGALMVLVTDVWDTQRLVRPLLGVGVLGGFTTFSSYVVDIQRLVDLHAAAIALGYLAGTVCAALAATYLGITTTRWAVVATRRRRSR